VLANDYRPSSTVIGLLATLGDDALDVGGVVEAHQAPAVAAKAKLGERAVIEPHAAEEAEVEPDHMAEQGADCAAMRDGHDRLALLVGLLHSYALFYTCLHSAQRPTILLL